MLLLQVPFDHRNTAFTHEVVTQEALCENLERDNLVKRFALDVEKLILKVVKLRAFSGRWQSSGAPVWMVGTLHYDVRVHLADQFSVSCQNCLHQVNPQNLCHSL